ncbi:non-homologous end-joining DNA ligase [Actinoallomurus soli]|uniref:non-homologous end-joining DNA ligase n=1 Tax=Actinoallomurus soli TaxID=2952535 RepID=UPI002092AA91|nr:non-homologous end-joining DNA ligase [Actinoallomurus soli]MCO5972287.1 non-homologous end-joining DNA ligase [Actinoallomurus soli]
MGELPRLIRPMMALLKRSLPPDQTEYGWELKWDGVRAVAYVQGRSLRLMSRNDKDITRSYPELAALARMLRRPAILDGEIVALRDGRPSFATLQTRMHVQRPGDRLIRAVPVQYYLFDVLHLDEESLLGCPYTERRDRLDGLGLDRAPVRVPPWWRGEGETVFAVGLAQGLEGVVGKPLRSHYHPGRRGPWIKVKNIRHQEVVIAGWLPGAGRRADMVGSLVLGVHDDGRLRYAGNVGTGFTEADLRDLAARLAPLARDEDPFDPPAPREIARRARWVEPVLVGEVAFAEWTPDGALRHPSWRGLRLDKRPKDVHREEPA